MAEGDGSRDGRIAVCVSGEGTNLRALHRAQARGLLGGTIVLVLADRPCAALGFAADHDIPTALVAPDAFHDRAAWDEAVARTLRAAAPGWVVLAGFMRLLGSSTLEAFSQRVLNVHPSLLPAFPGAHAVADALAAGARLTGVTVHVVDHSLDGGPIVAQEAVAILPDDDRGSLLGRLHAVEHRLLPRTVALALAGALRMTDGGVEIDADLAARALRSRRALLSVSEKRGVVDLGRALDQLGFELVSTGGTARLLRDNDLPVTDVADVTGFPEMLDGRVKTLHPRVSGGVLADMRRTTHRQQLAAMGIEPFELVVVNLYPFAEAAARPDTTLDELIEEVDIGGPTLVRAAAKNHASVGVVTDPAQYDAVVAELRSHGGLGEELRRELAAAAFRLTADYDEHISRQLALRWWPGADDEEPAEQALPRRLTIQLERSQPLRYGENPHQAAALYRASGIDLAAGPFAEGAVLVQGKPLSYNNILDASAAAGLARDLRGSACVIVKHANPCGAAEADDPLAAWEAALSADPVSAFGGVVAVTQPVDGHLAEQLTAIFLEVVVAPACSEDGLAALARRPNLRLLLDPALGTPADPGLELRTAGGGVLVTTADSAVDDASDWQLATRRAPTEDERQALEFAWRVCRHVKSNAIVLVRDRRLVGVGAGQMSRVDSARLAVEKAGQDRARGSVCASDAFYPFPDALEVCAAAGVTAFVQPGGSQRDTEIIAAADAAGVAMLMTGTRHFRH
jgi:phosphoribosylaminoimidazolecarboxamide formyltransferase / IMP cyclohydrolase